VLVVLLLRRRSLLSSGNLVGLLLVMRARRLVVAQDPLTRAMAAFLVEVEHRSLWEWDHVPTAGDLAADLERGPGSPMVDRQQPRAYCRRFLPHASYFNGMPSGTRITSLNFCPAGGGVGWHTDSGAPGWRVYVTRTLDGDEGAFLHAGGAWEDDARIAHGFYVSATAPFSWHAVRARGPRLSLGVCIGSTLATRLGLT